MESYLNLNDLDSLDELAERYETAHESGLEPWNSRHHLIGIYNRMLELSPNKEMKDRLEHNLLLLLMEQGWHHKERHQYDEAMHYFQQIIHNNPNLPIPRVHYRLGFIYDFQEDWLNASHHFSKALAEHRVLNSFGRADEENPKLTKEQLIKATMKLAIVSRKLSMETAISARDLFEESERPDDEMFETIEQMEETIRQTEEYPYTMTTRMREQHLTKDEYKRYAQELDTIYLDFASRPPLMHYNGNTCSVTPNERGLIEFLLESRDFQRQEELKERIQARSVEALRQNIHRLNQKGTDFLDLPQRIIDHTLDGYRWNINKYALLIHNDDPARHMK